MGNPAKYLIFLVFSIALMLGQNQAMSQKILQTNYVSVPPKIDGIIQKGEWQVVDSATRFIQMEPGAGLPATEATTVYVCFDSVAIYAAFIMHHKDPSGIVGRVQQRDNLTKSDDIAALVLDTYNDKRKAYVFFVNPIGTQIDMRVNDDGRNMDLNWDTEWESAAGRFDRGWIVEMAIPFKSINYRSGLTSWGFNAGRIIRHNAETIYWSGRLSGDFRVSQGGILEGIVPPRGSARVALFPYGTLRYDNPPLPDQKRFLPGNKNWRTAAGLDARIGITSQLDANLTINPDFATVEGDQEKINLTRWELSFPEKRLFFLEGNEMFSTRIKTFYSRRIGDINYGGKVTGKIGSMDMNVLSARTIEDTSQSEPAALFTAVRLKQDILRSSTVGLTLVDKSWSGGYSRSMSADYILNLRETWKLTGQYVGSMSEGLDSPWNTRSAWFVRVAKESNTYHAHVRYSNTGENFKENVNQTGFIRDDDMREVDSDLSYRWWMENKLIKYLTIEARNNVFWNHQGTLRSWYLTQAARIYTQQRFSLDLSYSDEFKLYEKKYYNNRVSAELGYNTDEWASASLAHSLGKNYDRDFRLTTLTARVKPVTSLALEYSLDILNFKPDPDNNSTVINILSANYNFTRDIWVRVFAQNNSSNESIYFYGLFGWRFSPPFGALYLIYTSDDRMVLNEPDKYQSRTFFVKLTYPILIGK